MSLKVVKQLFGAAIIFLGGMTAVNVNYPTGYLIGILGLLTIITANNTPD